MELTESTAISSPSSLSSQHSWAGASSYYQQALCTPDYGCVSKRVRMVKVAYRQPSRKHITDLIIDATGLRVFGEGEWKVRMNGAKKRRVWHRLYLAVDPVSHDIVAAEVSLENVHDAMLENLQII
jgi:hypothetical protein